MLRSLPGTPREFSVLHREYLQAKHKYHQSTQKEAERTILLNASELMTSADSRTEEQMMFLWPYLLDEEAPPFKDTARLKVDYWCTLRASWRCKFLNAEGREDVLEKVVWGRLLKQVRDAAIRCVQCPEEEALKSQLELVKQRAQKAGEIAAVAMDTKHRSLWPIGDSHTQNWNDEVPLLSVKGTETYELAGKNVVKEELLAALRAARKESSVLGLHCLPDSKGTQLDGLLRQIRSAGFKEIHLQAFTSGYPFRQVGYRVLLRGAKNIYRGRKSERVQTIVYGFERLKADGIQLR